MREKVKEVASLVDAKKEKKEEEKSKAAEIRKKASETYGQTQKRKMEEGKNDAEKNDDQPSGSGTKKRRTGSDLFQFLEQKATLKERELELRERELALAEAREKRQMDMMAEQLKLMKELARK